MVISFWHQINMHLTRVRSSTTLVGDYENYSKGVLADSQTVMLNFRAACQNKEFLKETFTLAKSNWKDDYFSQII